MTAGDDARGFGWLLAWAMSRDERKAADPVECEKAYRAFTCNEVEAAAAYRQIMEKLRLGSLQCRGVPVLPLRRQQRIRGALAAVGVEDLPPLRGDAEEEIPTSEWRRRQIVYNRRAGFVATLDLSFAEISQIRATHRPPQVFRDLKFSREEALREFPALRSTSGKGGAPRDRRESVKKTLRELYPPHGTPTGVKMDSILSAVNAKLKADGKPPVESRTLRRAIKENINLLNT